ncbi:MAG: MerR family transcriptional regulator [Bdellovibrionales bacterium]|nr:MerR family transcriptional regulator [Bdellovibrionales bacterium]
MYRIGEFSRIAQVSGRLLRYYDQIDLLKPVHIDPETGFRFYSASQLPRLNRILALKEMGLSLEQIARLLSDDLNADEIRGMLTMRKAEIERTMLEEMSRIRTIESRLKQIEHEGEFAGLDIVVKAIPEQTILGVRNVLPTYEASVALFNTLVTTLPAKVGRSELSHFIFIIHSELLEMENLDLEMGYVVSAYDGAISLNDEHIVECRHLPAVETMATFAVSGTMEDIHMGYGALGVWAEANNYRLAGAGREVILQMPRDNEQGTFEVQFPVEKLESTLTLLT